MMQNENKIAVVILNWNGCEMLRKFLPSVVQYSDNDCIDIYVADNGSTDDSVKMLHTEFPSVNIIILQQNYGFAEGYNKALEQISAQYAVLLNSDVEVTPNWLTPLASYMDSHPEVAACQPKILSYRDKNKFEYAGAAGGYLDKYGYPFCRGRILNVVETDYGQYDTITSIFWATGAALFIRLADYRGIGGLDGRFFAHMEEIDLCWRLRASGYDIVCIPQSVVYHVGGATLSKENPRKTFLNFRNNLLMLYKNLPNSELNSVMSVRTVLDYVAMLQYLFRGDMKNAKAVLSARKEYHKMKHDLAIDRDLNLQKTSISVVPERIKNSILWQFYAKGIRSFSQISNFK